LIFGRLLNDVLILIFWPGSIVLMSLGADRRPMGEVIYVWGIAIGLNIVLYLAVGLLVHYGVKLVRG
jgi:hypothetical protein